MSAVPLAVTAPAVAQSKTGVDLVRRCADWGFKAAWASEVDGPDAFTVLAALAATTDLDLGVGIVPVQTRAVFTLGMTAVSLAQLSGGRFTLGIGASSEVLVGRFGGMSFERPLSYLRETAIALRPILSGERSTFAGEHVRVGGYRPPSRPPSPVPLFFGSLNPRSLRLAGELADGLCVNQVAPQHVPAMLEEVRAGAAASGRELEGFPVMARIFCAVTDNVQSAQAVVAHIFAPYVATSVYNRFYRWMGYDEEAEAIQKASASKDREAMAAAFSDRIVKDLFVIGDVDSVVERLEEYVEAGVTIPVVAPLAAGPQDAASTLSAIGARWPSGSR